MRANVNQSRLRTQQYEPSMMMSDGASGVIGDFVKGMSFHINIQGTLSHGYSVRLLIKSDPFATHNICKLEP